MARLPVITEEKADEHTGKTYAAIKSKFGMVPNIFKGVANSSVTLDAYLKLDEMISNFFNHINDTDLDLPAAPEI